MFDIYKVVLSQQIQANKLAITGGQGYRTDKKVTIGMKFQTFTNLYFYLLLILYFYSKDTFLILNLHGYILYESCKNLF